MMHKTKLRDASQRNAWKTRQRFATLVLSIATSAIVSVSARAQTPSLKIASNQAAPNTCAAGYVWRRGDGADYVCVTPAQRDQIAIENAVTGVKNADGTCVAGYVWRQVDATDHVCVTPAQRREAAAQNAAATSHRLSSAAPVAQFEPHRPSGDALGAPGKRSQPPHPPSVVGCYTYRADAPAGVAPQWKKVACLSAQELMKVPHPTIGGNYGAPGILSQPTQARLGEKGHAKTSGLGGGLVAVSGGTWTVVDSAAGPGAYSVQLNTNLFAVTCHSSIFSEVSAILAAGLSGGPQCISGDKADVQFTYQTYDSGTTSVICIWNVDVAQQWYAWPQTWQECQNVPVPAAWQDTTLSVTGYVDFPDHLLTSIVALPWTTEWDSVVAPDWYGLCWTPGPAGPGCAWDQDSGTILGMGGGSLAAFPPNTSVQTTVQAEAACVGTGCNRQQLPLVSLANPYRGARATGYGTLETNNLQGEYFGGQVPAAVCSGTSCTLTYDANSNP
jgi:hypothetical protein